MRIDGLRRLYCVDPGSLRQADSWLDKFRAIWEPRLDALATEIARGERKRLEGDQ